MFTRRTQGLNLDTDSGIKEHMPCAGVYNVYLFHTELKKKRKKEQKRKPKSQAQQTLMAEQTHSEEMNSKYLF